jgi:type IV pilus assembly protein PilF
MRRVGWLGVLVCLCGVLLGCASQQAVVDQLTQPEADATRQRAMRRLALASAYFEQGQNEVAQSEARAALQIDACYAQAYNLLGLIHQRNNAPQLAEPSFAQALQWAQPAELGDIEHNYAWFLCQDQRYAEAQAHFARALAQPQYAQRSKTWLSQGVCQLRAGEAVQAQHSFEAALAADPHNATAQAQLNALKKK